MLLYYLVPENSLRQVKVSRHVDADPPFPKPLDLADDDEVWDMDELSALEAREEQKYGWSVQ